VALGRSYTLRLPIINSKKLHQRRKTT